MYVCMYVCVCDVLLEPNEGPQYISYIECQFKNVHDFQFSFSDS